jgi:hypothetical protein
VKSPTLARWSWEIGLVSNINLRTHSGFLPAQQVLSICFVGVGAFVAEFLKRKDAEVLRAQQKKKKAKK